MKIATPVYIVSGTRCLAHNTAVGGEQFSYHLPAYGIDGLRSYAADIRAKGMTAAELYDAARKIQGLGGIGVYRYADRRADFIHVDVRGFSARWAMIGGRKMPLTVALAWQAPSEEGEVQV